MKREINTLREILLQIEARPPGETGGIRAIPGISDHDLHGHVELLIDAGYLKGVHVGSEWGVHKLYRIEGITFEGYEFLDAIRHQTVFDQLKAKAMAEGGSLPMTILKDLATKYLRKHLGLD